MWGATAGRDLLTGHAAPGTVVRWPKSLTNRDSWPSDPEVFRRELTRPFSPALLLNLYRWDLKPLSSSAQRQKRRLNKDKDMLAMQCTPAQASQALQAVQAVQPMLHGESPPMMTPLQQVSHYCEIIQRVLSSIFRILLFPFRIQPSCHRWTLPRSLLLSSTAQFRLTLLSRY